MQIKIIYDKESTSSKLLAGWGVSYLVDGHILFDAGEKFQPLFKNMKNMSVGINDLDTAVISHDHWDHTGGLWELLKRRAGIKVYVCPGFGDEFKNRIKELGGELVEADGITRIDADVYTTGEIAGEYKGLSMPEQSLVVKTGRGISVMTGCSHPGILKILGKIKEGFPGEKIYSVFGGFHLNDKGEDFIEKVVEGFREMGVEKVGASHCSGDKAEELFRNKYKNDFIDVKAGMTIEL
ncbi:MAG: MBL fold metallo-hydrolase [Candidatus Margulisiibacteriota bacterium]|nr:MBL fold metallo-hydrolase [Candidatus Margulisiibacteriota bacterium]